MATIWIGDFRCRQIQQYQNNIANDNLYLIEDTAEYNWFDTELTNQLPQLSVESANAIIMLGFNDCVYSCAWKAFDIDKIAENYAKTINSLIKQYSSIKFYVCSVNPIDGDYPFAEQTTEVILEADLIKKIKRFNTKLEKSCNATYIDTFNYLTSTSFYTHDGVRFDADTIENILASISIHIGIGYSGGTLFVPRLTAPNVNAEVDNYWLGTSYGGLNPFQNLGQSHAKVEGDTLPNCTAYAWGRFYEILGSRPTLSTSNAEQWWFKTDDGYKRGQEPALGAVICWQAGATTEVTGADGAGHVAIVEQINPDGSIVTSESGYSSSLYWWKTTRRNTDGNWQGGSGYKFQGFIYCPTSTATISKNDLCVANSYGITKEQMKPNAQYIWQYLGAKGWTLNAVAGMLGNVEQESKFSPQLWETANIYTKNPVTIHADGTHTINKEEVDKIARALGRSNLNHIGYGLTQWTPYTKLLKWCDDRKLKFWDIDSQLQKIEDEAVASVEPGWDDYRDQWIKRPDKGYDLTFQDFISSTKDAYWLAGAFAFCYERPGRSTGTVDQQNALRKERGEMGKYWYDYLNSLPPITVGASTTSLQVKSLKIDEQLSTKAKLSFLVRNATKASYTIDEEKSKAIHLTNNFTVFDVKSLTPDTKYTLELSVEGDNKTTTEKISFTTEQERPESIERIKLTAKDTKLPCDNFKIDITPNRPNFGHWKSDGHGYAVQLIVNGRLKCEKFVNSLQTNFTISEYFGYKCKLGDIIQIGIRTWVQYKNKKLYDANYVKTSNAICMLTKPIITYLNID